MSAAVSVRHTPERPLRQPYVCRAPPELHPTDRFVISQNLSVAGGGGELLCPVRSKMVVKTRPPMKIIKRNYPPYLCTWAENASIPKESQLLRAVGGITSSSTSLTLRSPPPKVDGDSSIRESRFLSPATPPLQFLRTIDSLLHRLVDEARTTEKKGSEKGAEYLGDGHGVVTVGPFPRGTSGGCS